MKKGLFILLTLIVQFSFAQKPAASPAAVTESANVKITYGQPSKKDREIFGKLVPYGKVWRTGANAATEVTFKKDVDFGGKAVKAGTYTLFTIPEATEWTVILNPELKQWGSFGYDKIKDKNVAEIKVPVSGIGDSVEKLNIFAADDQITISWDKTMVAIPLKF